MSLLFRADAGARIGTGHVMRCLALAQAWQEEGGRAAFAVSECPPMLVERLRSEGAEVFQLSAAPGTDNDAAQTVELARDGSARWIVADGYHFGAAYQRVVKEAGPRLLLVDDYGQAEHYYADIVLNHNLSADPDWYLAKEPATKLLLGSRYALLRREFCRWRGWVRETPKVAHTILVTLGGSDPQNITLKALQALDSVAVDGLHAMVVVGSANPNYEELSLFSKQARFRIELNSAAADIAALMAAADSAVTAGGVTCWEAAFMGLPVATIVLADNQRKIAEALEKHGASLNLGWYSQLDETDLAERLALLINDQGRRERMSCAGRLLVDGFGAKRVVDVIMHA